MAAIGLMAIAYGAACFYLYSRQTRLLFFPTAKIETTPADFGLRYEEVWLPVGPDSADRIHGWWIPAQGEPTGTLLYLHGNGLNIGANAGQANRFHQMGLSVLLIDYRGYGRSGGAFPSEQAMYADAHVAWDYLVRDRQIPPEQILIYGHSLGGAIAIELASHQPDAAGLIVQSSFTAMQTVVLQHKPYLRIFPLELLLTQRFNSIGKLSKLAMPTLFIHGTADSTIPVWMSQQLYAKAPNPKTLWIVPDAEHNNVAETAGTEYFQVVQRFIGQVSRVAMRESGERH